MKEIKMIFLVVLVGLFVSVGSVFAEPPKKDRCQWTSVSAVSVNSQSSLRVLNSQDEQEITTPNVWFGGWGENEEYFLGFYAEGVNSKYQVIYGVKELPNIESWDYVSLITPQSTQVLHNQKGYETDPFPYVQTGVYVPGPGEYALEVRVYVTSEWYFLYKETVTVPPFEAWLSNVCTDGKQVNLSFTAYPLFSFKFEEGDTVKVEIGDLFFEVVVSFVNEWGDAKFKISVGADIYGDLLDHSTLTVFGLVGGETYSQDVYYWEGDPCEEDQPVPTPVGEPKKASPPVPRYR